MMPRDRSVSNDLRRWGVNAAIGRLPLTVKTERRVSRYFRSRVRANCSLTELSVIEIEIAWQKDPERRAFFRRIFLLCMGVHYIRLFLTIGDLPAADGVAGDFVSLAPESGDDFVKEEYRRYLQLAPWISESACEAIGRVSNEQ